MRFGTSYYPELIDEAEWIRDLDLMRSCGLDHLRLLDFAWTAIEPSEGVYAWEWLDRFFRSSRFWRRCCWAGCGSSVKRLRVRCVQTISGNLASPSRCSPKITRASIHQP